MRVWITAAVLAAALCGCTAEPEQQPEAEGWIVGERIDTAGLDDAQRTVLDALMAACPGLEKYRDDWTLVSVDVEDAPKASRLKLVMDDRLEHVPGEYYAIGQHCFAEVGGERPDRVAVWKRPCVKVCRDVNEDVPTSTLIEIL